LGEPIPFQESGEPLQSKGTEIMVAELAEKLAGLTIAQAVELKNLLKEKYGIEPAGGGAVMMQQSATPQSDAPAKVEVTEFNVLIEPGFDAAKKAAIIKTVREITGWSLMDCKAAVEGAPKAVKENADKKTADDLKKKLEEAGAKVSVKPAG
jgi:large subunit ribosomal protein L7/L12